MASSPFLSFFHADWFSQHQFSILQDDKLKEQINQKKIAQKAKQKSEVNVQTPKISTEEKPPEPELHQVIHCKAFLL